MAWATVKGVRHEVRVVADFPNLWAVEVYPPAPPGAEKRSEPYKPWPVPLVMKLYADSKEHALVTALEHLKKVGRIDDFHVEEHEKPPAPPAPPAPAAAEPVKPT